MGLPDDFLAFWRALDDLLSDVRQTSWGAVVTDPRFPSIWDTNYARIDRSAGELTLNEVERILAPALDRAKAHAFHVVSFVPDETTSLLAALSSRGDRLSWDVVMRREGAAAADSPPAVVELHDDERWDAVRRSLTLFGIDDPDAVDQLLRLEREVLHPADKRWFGVRDRGRLVSIGALMVLEGTGYVDDVATEPAVRGRGFASAITSRLVAEAKVAGAQSVFLLTETDGPVPMYERLGFREVGRVASTRGPFPRGTAAGRS